MAQVDQLQPSTHYINGYFHIVVAFKSPIRIDAWACKNVFGTSNKSIIADSRFGINDVTFRASPPTGGQPNRSFFLGRLLLLRTSVLQKYRGTPNELINW